METMPVVILWGRNSGPTEGRELSLNRFAHRMHSRFLEQRTISQGSIYAAPAAWNRRGDGRRSAYPNSFTYFPLSRKYIRVLSPLPFFSTVSWLFHFFSLSFFLWLLESVTFSELRFFFDLLQFLLFDF